VSSVDGSGEVALDAAPFSYAVEVEGVHLTLAHIVDQVVAPEVKRWLESDLAATDAQTRIVVGHVPIVSVMSGARPWLRNDTVRRSRRGVVRAAEGPRRSAARCPSGAPVSDSGPTAPRGAKSSTTGSPTHSFRWTARP
jgi:hypothetical protein